MSLFNKSMQKEHVPLRDRIYIDNEEYQREAEENRIFLESLQSQSNDESLPEKTESIEVVDTDEPKKQKPKKTNSLLQPSINFVDEFNKEEEEKKLEERQLAENDVVKRVRERIRDFFKERIGTEKNTEAFKTEMREKIDSYLMDEGEIVETVEDRERLLKRIYDLIMGLGPLEELFDKGYSEIMVTRYDKIFVEQHGKMVNSGIKFGSEDELRTIIDQIVQSKGRAINESHPTVDARLDDGSRVNAVVPPISVDGAQLTIRRFPEKNLTEKDYLNFGSADRKILDFLKHSVEGRFTTIVSGGTGSGKTSLLNLMSNYLAFDPGLSVVTIEDSCELRLNHPNVRREETKESQNQSGVGEVTARVLVKNSMRMRPDVIIVGEIRDYTILDYLRLATSGHDGGLTTIHNESPETLEDTIQMLAEYDPKLKLSEGCIRRLYGRGVDLIVQIRRYPDHVRRISHISHVVGFGSNAAKELGIDPRSNEFDRDAVYIRDIFRWVQTGMDKDGNLIGDFKPTGYVPKALIEKAASNGVVIDTSLFEVDRSEVAV